MKTHISNTTAQNLKNDILSHTMFQNHQQALHSGNVKPIVVTKHDQEIKIVRYIFILNQRNKKVELNTNPNIYVNHLFNNLYNKSNQTIKSAIDNKPPQSFKLKETILKDKMKKNKHEKHKMTEHEKEWKALQNRIENCKSLQQRKKDKNDPIVNPVYFIKDGSSVGNLTIEPYCKKVLNKNRPKSAVMVGTKNSNMMHMTMGKAPTKEINQSESVFYGSSVPDFSKTSNKIVGVRPSSAIQNQKQKENAYENYSDLPEPTFKGILSHLLENKLYKDTDLKVLYVRLSHAYGEDNIDEIWEQVMDHFES